MPILAYEGDGSAVAPSFLRQVEVHIQQVLDLAARNHAVPLATMAGLPGLFRTSLGKLD